MEKMPTIFLGHGSPMNAIENNKYTEKWKSIGETYTPKGIVMISAHWFTNGLYTQIENKPQKINDMDGFPDELYTKAYQVEGSESLTAEIKNIFKDEIKIADNWGIDHGSWVVLSHMYPKANIPVVQISVDFNKSPKEQFEIGQKLAHLRSKGYMIIGSGNVVHNLQKANWNQSLPDSWVSYFDDYIEQSIVKRNFTNCLNYLELGEAANLAVPTADHFYPLLTVLGTVSSDDKLTVFNKAYELGSISMTSYLFK